MIYLLNYNVFQRSQIHGTLLSSPVLLDGRYDQSIKEYLFLLQMFHTRILYNYLRMQKQSLNITLTPQEELLFGTLLQYKQQLGLNTVMRVAGGWVRDKIMGKESHDIDITLDNMKGEQFVLKLKSYAESKNQKISSFGVTKFNPELSKHLETATARICDHSIDFVNLRSETYNETSRVPQIQMGTPLTDALRRDFTINSLFYNIDTKQIEDWTEKGISDIAKRILRTPLAPLVTFKDDPLRVLRCFRFKARFDFMIDELIYDSLKDEGVHDALQTKVSKERVGIELAGMIKADHPLCALEEVFKYKYWNIIFQIPEGSDLNNQQYISSIPEFGFNLVKNGLQSLKKWGLKTQKELLTDPNIKDKRQRYSQEQLKFLTILTLLTLPYQGFNAPDGKKTMALAEHIARNELKYSAKVAKFIQKTGELAINLQKIMNAEHPQFKIRVARWLRQAEQKWEIAIHCLNALRMIRQEFKLEMEPLVLREWIFQNKLEEAYLVQPFVDGTFITKRGKKGPIVKVILDNAVLWRILNPDSPKEDFLQLLQKNPGFFQNQKSYA